MCFHKGSNEKISVGKETKETVLVLDTHLNSSFSLSPTSYINTGNHLTFTHYFIYVQIGHCPQGTYMRFRSDNKVAKMTWWVKVPTNKFDDLSLKPYNGKRTYSWKLSSDLQWALYDTYVTPHKQIHVKKVRKENMIRQSKDLMLCLSLCKHTALFL